MKTTSILGIVSVFSRSRKFKLASVGGRLAYLAHKVLRSRQYNAGTKKLQKAQN